MLLFLGSRVRLGRWMGGEVGNQEREDAELGQRLDADLHPATSGLIIDAFGELRDQQEQVREDMEVGHV